MSALDWLKRRLAGEEAELVFAPGEESFAGLDMRKAIEAHAAWIRRLNGVLAGERIDLTAAEASVDNRCDLGKWIYSTGQARFGASGDYKSLLEAHLAFHRLAGEIMREHERGRPAAELQPLLRSMRDLSGRVQLGIIRLFSSARS